MEDGVIRAAAGARQFLTPDELAARWGMTRHGLAFNRQKGQGPRFLQLGPRGRILYPLDEVLAYEEAQLRRSTEPELPLGGSRHGS